MRVNIYLILLIVLLIFNLVFWVIVIWFRIFYDCPGSRSRRNTRNRGSSGGQTNPGFNEEDPARTLQRPFAIPEAMESPPSYEEALKYDQFGFRITYPQDSAIQRLDPSSLGVGSTPRPYEHAVEVVAEASSSSAAESRYIVPSNSTPSTSFGDASGSRLPSSSSSQNLTPQLSTISEEDDTTMPVTLVIDCIGVQAARLIENCDTTVNLTNGQDLDKHSKC